MLPPTYSKKATSTLQKNLTSKRPQHSNLKDLFNQAAGIFRKKPTDDYFASGRLELPNGQKQRIFIAQNETGRYTAMLPEDY
jgi:hypothetical protein